MSRPPSVTKLSPAEKPVESPVEPSEISESGIPVVEENVEEKKVILD